MLGPSRSKIRLAVCRCFRGRCLSSARMASMTPCHGPSLGRRMGACRRYPGGNEYSSIFLIVFRASPNYRATARSTLAFH